MEDQFPRRSGRQERSKAPDRLPPSAPEAEKSLLGCVLAEADVAIPLLMELGFDREMFYDLRNQDVYSAVLELYDAKKPVDSMTVMQRLRDLGDLETCGGAAFLISLTETVLSAANTGFYAETVMEKARRRKIINKCTLLTMEAYEEAKPIAEVVGEAEAALMDLSKESASKGITPMAKLVEKSIERTELYHQHQGKPMGVPTGFVDLDCITSGMHPGDYIIIAGRPSTGKTAIALNIAEHAVLNADPLVPTGVFSLEMTAESLVHRMHASNARVSNSRIRSGQLNDCDFQALGMSAARLANAPLHIDDQPGITLAQLKSKARQMVKRFGCKFFIVDYLQLIHGGRKGFSNRQEEVSYISTGIKEIAKELSVPFLVLAQLNRDSEREKRKPRLSDLRESGSIEQDGDLIGALYRPEAEKAEAGGNYGAEESARVNLLVLKQRNGPTGDIPFTYFPPFTRFENAVKEQQPEKP